jgi:hypothetical protein
VTVQQQFHSIHFSLYFNTKLPRNTSPLQFSGAVTALQHSGVWNVRNAVFRLLRPLQSSTAKSTVAPTEREFSFGEAADIAALLRAEALQFASEIER